MRLPSATAAALNAPAETPRARIEHAARELETQFAQMLLKSMRSAGLGDPLFGDGGPYRELYDQQLARELARGRGLGLAPGIVRQLERSAAATPAAPPSGPLPLAPAAPAAAFPLGAPAALPLAPSDSGVSLPGLDPASLPAPPAADACDTDAPLDCSSPEAFARSIWPHARKAAAELGVDPRALVAQAALETGWGRRLPQDAEGGGHNLFGIKAGASWSGGRAQARTHEYVDGARREEVASFRTYDSPAASFADYVRLLKTSPRYAQALGAGDARRFAGALQRAGYATDPGYAAKIAAIAEGPTLQRALAGVGGAQRG